MIKRTLCALLVLVIFLVSLSGCSSLSYYSQSVVGHSRLMLARQPVSSVLKNASPELKSQLELSQSLRAFAASELGLPQSKSYSSYVALEREFPVWTVVAAPKYSLDAQQWCYPVIGCASYRGYFNKAGAYKFARVLQDEGLETTVGGAPAYSTLGWFSDPLLPSMMRYGDTNLAETLFHELAHQQLYINGDSDFNEAFATVVGEEGARRWLKQNRQKDLLSYQSRLAAHNQFSDLIMQSKGELKAVYAQELNDTERSALKAKAFTKLAANYQRLKSERWQGKGWFDNWFNQPLNNARLAAFSTYRARVPELQALLISCENDLPRFYSTLIGVRKADNRVVVPSQCADRKSQ